MSRAYVVGGGLAGLATALAFLDQGVPTTLYEATRYLGGRCRSFVDAELGLIDNGTHVLVGANRTALALLARLGVSDYWQGSPEADIAFADMAEGTVYRVTPSVSGLMQIGLSGGDVVGLLRLLGPDRPVSTNFPQESRLYRRLIEPVTLATLNAHPSEASSRLLGSVLRESWRGRKALLPLVAERGCGPDLVEPLVALLRRLGGQIETQARLVELHREGNRAAALGFADQCVELDDHDRVVFAGPPGEAGRLLGLSYHLPVSPIVNAHFKLAAQPAPTPLFFGVSNSMVQWILLRGSIASVTISAADRLIALPAEQLAADIWQDVRRALSLFGIDAGARPVAERLIKEKRATLRQTAGLVRPYAETGWDNVFLAGDWTETGLPATIEGALRSGSVAARAALERRRPRGETDRAAQ